MKWQTGCQTPHGCETLTHRLMDWVDGRGGEDVRRGRRMDGMETGWEGRLACQP